MITGFRFRLAGAARPRALAAPRASEQKGPGKWELVWDFVLDVLRIMVLVGLVVWLVDLVRGRERVRDDRGRLRPGFAALVSVVALGALAVLASALAEWL